MADIAACLVSGVTPRTNRKPLAVTNWPNRWKNSDWPVLHMADRQFIQSPSTFFGFAIPNVCYRLLSTWTTYGSADLSPSSTRWKSRPQFVCPKAVNQMASGTNFPQVE